MSAVTPQLTPPPLLSMADEADLAWFFSSGQTAFERSTFGSMLERAELFSVANQYQPSMQPVLDSGGHVIGWERALSARPTAELRQNPGYDPDIHVLERYARISARLKRVEQKSRMAAHVLELLHGDYGQRWAGSEPFGRMGCLFHVTVKGRAMIAAAKKVKGASLELSDAARMEVIAAVHRVQPQPERSQALAFCSRQAQVLDQQARLVWHDVTRVLQMAG